MVFWYAWTGWIVATRGSHWNWKVTCRRYMAPVAGFRGHQKGSLEVGDAPKYVAFTPPVVGLDGFTSDHDGAPTPSTLQSAVQHCALPEFDLQAGVRVHGGATPQNSVATPAVYVLLQPAARRRVRSSASP